MAKLVSKPIRILVVGISQKVCRQVAHSMEECTAAVGMCEMQTWEEVRKHLQQHESEHDVLLIEDSALAEKDWVDIKQWLASEEALPAILMAGKPTREHAIKAYHAGFKDYIEADEEERYLVYLPHTLLRLVDHERAHSARITVEQALKRVSVAVNASSGRKFFHELTRQIVDALDVDFAMMGELIGSKQERIRSVSYANQERLLSNFEYSIKDTPCELLISQPSSVFPEDVCKQFPKDKQLQEINAQSYIGVPLRNHENQTTGLLCVMHSKPLSKPDVILSVLKIMAARAEMELDRERTQSALQRQARIVEQLGEAVIGADIDGNITSWNHQAEALFDCTVQNAIGRRLTELLPDPDEGFVNRHFVEPLLIHGNHFIETKLRRISGSTFHAHLSLSQEKNNRGEVVGIIACCRDISTRVHAEKQRREAQERLKLHVNRTPLACIEWDLQSRIVAWNASAERMFGYKEDDIIGQPYSILVEPKMSESVKHIFERLFRGDGGFYSTNDNVRSDGELITCEWYNTPLTNEEGDIVGVASLVNDISDRIRYEKELKASKEAADAANRSKDDFLAVMSHEIRTPMNSIIGFADLLRELADDEEQLETIEIIKSNGYALLELINNVLNYSRLDSGLVTLEKRDTDIDLLLNEVDEAMRVDAEHKHLKLSYDVEDGLPHLFRTDYLELRQILLNLVGNAIKFTNEGEINVTVSARKPIDDSDNWTYIFAVRDTGVGIAKEKLDQLFKSFSQVDSSSTRRYGGTGLGLAICRKICHLLEGDIWAESIPGRGSTFYFTIQAQAVGDAPDHALSSERPQTHQQLNILLVENEDQTRQLLEEIIKQMGYSCESAVSGQEAIECIRQEHFDLVFMDVGMDDMDGQETTRRIRSGEAGQDKADTYICALTAYTHGDDKQSCLEAGMNDHLGKPILTKHLRAVIDLACQRRVKPD